MLHGSMAGGDGQGASTGSRNHCYHDVRSCGNSGGTRPTPAAHPSPARQDGRIHRFHSLAVSTRANGAGNADQTATQHGAGLPAHPGHLPHRAGSPGRQDGKVEDVTNIGGDSSAGPVFPGDVGGNRCVGPVVSCADGTTRSQPSQLSANASGLGASFNRKYPVAGAG